MQAFGRELQFARGAVHQLNAKPQFEPRDQLAHRGRRHVEQARRGGKAAGLDHLHEGFHFTGAVHIDTRHGSSSAFSCDFNSQVYVQPAF